MGFIKPDSNKVAVYFVRKNIFGTATRMNIFDNNQCIGATIGGSYIRYECIPGEHMFWTWSEFNDHKAYLPTKLEAGKTYIIEVYATLATNKERKLSGKSVKSYSYTMHIEGVKPTDKRQKQLVAFIKKSSARSYPEKVILRLNSEYQLEIKDASENFKKNLNSLKLNIEDYVPSDLFN